MKQLADYPQQGSTGLLYQSSIKGMHIDVIDMGFGYFTSSNGLKFFLHTALVKGECIQQQYYTRSFLYTILINQSHSQ